MVNNCVKCGRGLRTGRKYCHEHRGSKIQSQNSSERKCGEVPKGYLQRKDFIEFLSIMGVLGLCFITVLTIMISGGFFR